MKRFKKESARYAQAALSALSVIAMAAVCAMLFASCASTGGGGGGGSASKERGIATTRRVPDFVKNAIKNAPEDALIGVGMAKLASTSQSRTIAVTRARADISRQLNSTVRDMVRDYQASSEVEPKEAVAFQETITAAFSKSTLVGTKVIEEDIDADGAYWVVVQMGKTSVAQEINQKTAAAKLAVPAAQSFDAEKRMNEAFDKIAKEDIQVMDR